MSNRFYNFVNQLISGSVAKASEVNAELQGAEVGFLAVEEELNTAIKLPASESATNQRIVESPAQRAGTLLQFDADGDLKVSAQLQGDIDANDKRIRNVRTAEFNDEPVTLAQMSSYSAGLAGLPSLLGHTGCLVTDGASVSWGDAGRNVPSTLTNYGGEFLCSIGGESKWLHVRPNAVKDPNGLLGTGWWSTSLARFDDVGGQGWTNGSVLSGSTFEHKPVATAGYVVTGAGAAVAASVNVQTSGASAGTIEFVLRYYDAGYVLLSESTPVSISLASAQRQYAISVTTPASTAYTVPVIKFNTVSSSAYGIIVRNMKMEKANYASPFNDFKTLSLAYGASAQTFWGTGYANPIVTIGDGTSTLGCLDLRGTSGAQQYDARIQVQGGVNGTSGKGAITVYAQRTHFSGPQGALSEYDAGNSGSAITIDFSANGQFQKVTLNAATPAITLGTTGLPVGKYQLRVLQDATGSRAPTWVNLLAANCVGNAFPTIASTASGVTFVSLYWDGSQWWGAGNPWD